MGSRIRRVTYRGLRFNISRADVVFALIGIIMVVAVVVIVIFR
jgi:hypothetical protein